MEDHVLIGGFAKKDAPLNVLLRASGPSLENGGAPLTGVLADPRLTLVNSGDGGVVASNDNWRDSEWAGEIAFDLQPGDFLESAILVTLDPGNYTAVIKGAGGKTGVGMVEIYVVSGDGHLFNLSARGFSGQGDNAMISGFTLQNQPSTVLIRAIGKDLENHGVSGVLPDPCCSSLTAQPWLKKTETGGVVLIWMPYGLNWKPRSQRSRDLHGD